MQHESEVAAPRSHHGCPEEGLNPKEMMPASTFLPPTNHSKPNAQHESHNFNTASVLLGVDQAGQQQGDSATAGHHVKWRPRADPKQQRATGPLWGTSAKRHIIPCKT